MRRAYLFYLTLLVGFLFPDTSLHAGVIYYNGAVIEDGGIPDGAYLDGDIITALHYAPSKDCMMSFFVGVTENVSPEIYNSVTKELTIPESVDAVTDLVIIENSFFGYLVQPLDCNKINLPSSFIGCDFWGNLFGLPYLTVSESNPLFSSQDGVLFNKKKTKLINYPVNGSEKNETYTIPDLVTTIEARSFEGALLKSITLGKNTFVVDGAFTCGVEEFEVSPENPYYTAIDGVLYSKDLKKLICYPAGRKDSCFEVPAGVEEISESAFTHCSYLEDIKLPSSLKTLGEEALTSTSLKKLELPDSVDCIGANALWGKIDTLLLSNSLHSVPYQGAAVDYVYIPESVKTFLGGFNPKSEHAVIELSSMTPPYANTYNGEPLSYLDSWEVIVPDGALPNYLCSYFSQAGKLREKNGKTAAIDNIFSDGKLFYQPISDSEVIVVSDESYKTFATASIPRRAINEGKIYTVIGIGYEAFKDCPNLASVTFPTSLAMIGDHAFQDCNMLSDVSLPSSIKLLGTGAFHGCRSIATIDIPESITEIPAYAFYETAITKIDLPVGITSIGEYAFGRCESLEEVVIPEGVKSIDCVFAGSSYWGCCKSLKSVHLPQSLISMDGAFTACISLSDIKIPSSVKSMKAAFQYCRSLDKTNITIPAGTTELTNQEFYEAAINTLTIPSSVTKVGSKVFELATINTIVFEDGDLPVSFEDDILYYDSIYVGRNCIYEDVDIFTYEKSPLVSSRSVTIGPNVTSYPEGGFNTSGVTFLNSEIQPGMFDGSKILQTVTIGDNITAIPDRAFANCTALTSLNLGNNVVSIGNSALSGCIGLKNLNLSEPLKEIGNQAFVSCSGLTSLELPHTLEKIGSYAFSECSGISECALPNSLQSTGDYAFFGCTELENVDFGVALEEIGNYAFANCNLKQAILSPDVQSIGIGAFSSNSLTRLSMGPKVQFIGIDAFYDNPDLTEVSITATTPPMADDESFENYTCNLYVTPGYEDDYVNAAACWNHFTSVPLIEAERVEIQGNKSITTVPNTTFTLTATIYPENVNLPYIFWRSTNPAVASVDNYGVVTVHGNNASSVRVRSRFDAPANDDNASCTIIAETLYSTAPLVEVDIEVDNTFGGIEDNVVEKSDIPVDIYTLQGICLKREATIDDIRNLSPGLYIIGGEKRLVK